MLRINLLFSIGLFLLLSLSAVAQTQYPIFNDRKIINSFSTETLDKGMLDFRVAHRFGDMFGEGGGWPTFYGLENASDVMIGFDYGITDHLLAGLNRTKGSGALRQLVNTYLKYKIAGQNDTRPDALSVAFLGMTTISTQQKSEEATSINSFPKFAHRMAFHFQMMAAKRFSQFFSAQLSLGYTHRNFVNIDDINYVLNIGLAGRFQMSKALALVLEGNLPLRFETVTFEPTVPLGIGLEWMTSGGHVFQLNFTNASGLSETDYLSYTRSQWSEGQFRLGFTIARQFRIR